MNVCCTHVMPMLVVQTMTVRLSVGAELDFLEMDLLVQVSNVKWRRKNVKLEEIFLKYFTFLNSIIVCYLYFLSRH